MTRSVAHLLAAGAAFAALGAAPAVFAGSPVSGNGVDPIAFGGFPELEDVIKACPPKDIPETFGGVLELIMTSVPNQGQSNTFPELVQPSHFRVEVTAVGSNNDRTYNIRDISTPSDDQFLDIQGIDAIVLRDSGSRPSNIYCQVNNIADTGLGLPSLRGATMIAFYWVIGPCALGPTATELEANLDLPLAEFQDSLDDVCTAYNGSTEPTFSETSADFLQGWIDSPEAEDQIANFCGCTLTFRFCETRSFTPGPNNQILTCPVAGSTAFLGQGAVFGDSPASVTSGGRTVTGR